MKVWRLNRALVVIVRTSGVYFLSQVLGLRGHFVRRCLWCEEFLPLKLDKVGIMFVL